MTDFGRNGLNDIQEVPIFVDLLLRLVGEENLLGGRSRSIEHADAWVIFKRSWSAGFTSGSGGAQIVSPGDDEVLAGLSSRRMETQERLMKFQEVMATYASYFSWMPPSVWIFRCIT